MNPTFEQLAPDHARQILDWRYASPYEIYDYRDTDRETALGYLADPVNRFFGVLIDGELIGFRSFGPDGRVEGGTYDDTCLDTGGGLRPDLTGKGLGVELVRKGLEFGAGRYGVNRFRVTVAAFNQRALKVCRRVGFVEQQRFLRPGDRQAFLILVHVLQSDGAGLRSIAENQGSGHARKQGGGESEWA